eukprot:jgi/Bigna1/68224/fgenesh1_pg.5_\
MQKIVRQGRQGKLLVLNSTTVTQTSDQLGFTSLSLELVEVTGQLGKKLLLPERHADGSVIMIDGNVREGDEGIQTNDIWSATTAPSWPSQWWAILELSWICSALTSLDLPSSPYCKKDPHDHDKIILASTSKLKLKFYFWKKTSSAYVSFVAGKKGVLIHFTPWPSTSSAKKPPHRATSVEAITGKSGSRDAHLSRISRLELNRHFELPHIQLKAGKATKEACLGQLAEQLVGPREDLPAYFSEYFSKAQVEVTAMDKIDQILFSLPMFSIAASKMLQSLISKGFSDGRIKNFMRVLKFWVKSYPTDLTANSLQIAQHSVDDHFAQLYSKEEAEILRIHSKAFSEAERNLKARCRLDAPDPSTLSNEQKRRELAQSLFARYDDTRTPVFFQERDKYATFSSLKDDVGEHFDIDGLIPALKLQCERSGIHAVKGGDHALNAAKRWLKIALKCRQKVDIMRGNVVKRGIEKNARELLEAFVGSVVRGDEIAGKGLSENAKSRRNFFSVFLILTGLNGPPRSVLQDDLADLPHFEELEVSGSGGKQRAGALTSYDLNHENIRKTMAKECESDACIPYAVAFFRPIEDCLESTQLHKEKTMLYMRKAAETAKKAADGRSHDHGVGPKALALPISPSTTCAESEIVWGEIIESVFEDRFKRHAWQFHVGFAE